VSAFLARREVMEVFGPGDHGSTFGGNPLAAAVGLEALAIIVEDDFAGRAARLGDYFLAELRAIESPLIRDVRGKGLLTGIEVDTSRMPARTLCERLLANGVLSKDTHETVIRLAPPLVITQEQIDEALASIRATLAEIDGALERP
jgi:ornithine--oxo-acid transaminase